MASLKFYSTMALSLPEVVELPHFEKTSFRVGKKIFATLDKEKGIGCIKLSEIDQSAFCAFDKLVIYPVPNKWGKQGWTNINIALIGEEMLEDALKTAYCQVAPKALGLLLKKTE